jgi:DnaJ-class molecular chaperone
MEIQLRLTEQCYQCDGSGKRYFKNEGGQWDQDNCALCDGTGERLTEIGEAIMLLVETHLERRKTKRNH